MIVVFVIVTVYHVFSKISNTYSKVFQAVSCRVEKLHKMFRNIFRKIYIKIGWQKKDFILNSRRKLEKPNFSKGDDTMTLVEANIGEEYIIKNIATDDEELNSFLFSLGCYSGEPITVVSRKKRNCTVSIKDGRYNIDNELAAAILV